MVKSSPMSVKSRPCAILFKDETERIDSRVLEIKTPILYIIPNGQVSFLNVNDISILKE